MYLNKKNILKYSLQFLIVSLTSYTLSPCNLKVGFAVTIGLISASVFALIDTYYPIVVYKNKSHDY
jgi:hypothetical protein